MIAMLKSEFNCMLLHWANIPQLNWKNTGFPKASPGWMEQCQGIQKRQREDILVKAKQPLPCAHLSAGKRVRTSVSNLISETQLWGKSLKFPQILSCSQWSLKGRHGPKNLKDSRGFVTNVLSRGGGVQGCNFHDQQEFPGGSKSSEEWVRQEAAPGESCTHTVTGNTLLAAVTVMQVLNTTCSQWPCRTHSSEFQAAGRVKVMFISSWDSLPVRNTQGKLGFGSQKYLSNNCWDKENTQVVKAGSITPWSQPGSLQATKGAKRKVKPKTKQKILQLLLFLISPTSSGCFQKLKTLSKWIHACSQTFIRKAFLLLRTLFHICFFLMLTFQTGDICVERKISADSELHIKSCMTTPRGEIQTENKSRLLQMELAFGSSQSSNKITTETPVMHICSSGQCLSTGSRPSKLL